MQRRRSGMLVLHTLCETLSARHKAILEQGLSYGQAEAWIHKDMVNHNDALATEAPSRATTSYLLD